MLFKVFEIIIPKEVFQDSLLASTKMAKRFLLSVNPDLVLLKSVLVRALVLEVF